MRSLPTCSIPPVFRSQPFGLPTRALRAGFLGLALWAFVGCDARPGDALPGSGAPSPAAESAGESSMEDASPEALGLPEPGEVTIIAMPDIQWYSLTAETIADDGEDGRLAEFLAHFDGGPQAPDVLEAMQSWILANAAAQRIAFVSYVGDVVERGGAPESRPRWEVTRESLDQVHGRVPYGIAVGNHDMVTETGDTSLFQEFFGEERFAEFDWYEGSLGNNESSVQRVALPDGGHLLFLHLTCNAPAEVLAWADDVLGDYPDDHVFVTTHMLLGPVERHGGEVPSGMETGLMQWTKCHGDRGLNALEAWERFLGRHPSIRAVLSGDQSYSQALHEVREGEAGNPVLLMTSDYKQISREGYLRVLRYHPDTGTIRVVTYSPVLDQVLGTTEIVPDPARHNFEVVTGGLAVDR